MKTTTVTIAGAVALCAALMGASAPPAFTKKPVVTKEADKVVVTFTADRQTDVAVFVEDRDGTIVRHVAAGVLGANPPAPLRANSLEQTIAWDGKDDDGKAAVGGPFRVRVALGLKAEYAGLAFADPEKTGPNRLESVIGLAVGPDGRVFVLGTCAGWGWFRGTKAHVLRRDGTYEKTIKPYPPTLPPARTKAFGAFINSFGAVNPILYRPEGISLYPHDDAACQPAVTPDGRIILANWNEMSAYGAGPGVLATIDWDGGCPEATYGGPVLPAGWSGYAYLASSADGKNVYFTGLGAPKRPRHAVYSAKLPDRGPAEVFFGDPAQAGADRTHLSDPQGVAADGQGRIFVADFGNNRVVVLNEKDKTFAGSFAVEAPTWIAVHPGTGSVYVCSKRADVVKFSPFAAGRDPREQARLSLAPILDKIDPRRRDTVTLAFALDSSAEPAAVWIGCADQLSRFEDEGAKFGEAAPAKMVSAQFFWRPASDPTRKEVACRIGGSWDSRLVVLDEATGKMRTLGRDVAGSEGRLHRLGPDGAIYGVDHAQGVIRFDRDGKPRPFEATAKDAYLRGRLPAGNTGTTSWERDFWVDRKNDIYVRRRGVEYHGHMTVLVFDQAGRLKRTALWMVSDAMYGPRVDAQGNMYIIDLVKPVGQAFPDEFKDRLTTGRRTTHWYDWIYGSVIKFGPEGGAIWFAGNQESPVDYEGWRLTGNRTISGLRTTGGSLTGTIVKKPAGLSIPVTSLTAAAQTTITFRLRNDSDGTQASLGWHVVGEAYGTPARVKTIAIKPNSDFTEYTFDLSGEKEWKGSIYGLTLNPTDGARGTFSIDWVRVGGPDSPLVWNFDAEDSQDKKLPDTLKKEEVGTCSYMLPPRGTILQGAMWYRPGFSHIGNVNNNDHCHCMGNDFDMDDFGRIFAPDSARFRVGVLDASGNEVMSFGGYGNQDNCGPESAAARPEIPFGWIVGVAVTDQFAYVDDVINKRILRVKLGYAASETAAVP